jgi:hypothetical protein
MRSLFFVISNNLSLSNGKKGFLFENEALDAVINLIMLFTILLFKKHGVAFNAKDFIVTIEAPSIPHVLFHALDEAAGCAARRGWASESAATLNPEIAILAHLNHFLIELLMYVNARI